MKVRYEGAKYTLQATPIEQVIHDGQGLHESDTMLNRQKFKHRTLSISPLALACRSKVSVNANTASFFSIRAKGISPPKLAGKWPSMHKIMRSRRKPSFRIVFKGSLETSYIRHRVLPAR
ncbi:MAG: hypothetical protein ABI977_26560 [Acidobacteriota bacterium]